MSAADAPTVKRPFFRRKKTCPFTGPKAPAIDWKDTKTLRTCKEHQARTFHGLDAICEHGYRSCPSTT